MILHVFKTEINPENNDYINSIKQTGNFQSKQGNTWQNKGEKKDSLSSFAHPITTYATGNFQSKEGIILKWRVYDALSSFVHPILNHALQENII